MNQKNDSTIRRFRRLRRLEEDYEDLVSNFPMRGLNERLDANPLNLRNQPPQSLRRDRFCVILPRRISGLWIFNFWDVG